MNELRQPEKIRSKTLLYNLGSASCDNMLNGTMLSNGLWEIPNFIDKNDNIEHIYFSVVHAEVPNSFYLINQYNCVFSVTVTGVTTAYNIPLGNYNINTLLATLRTLLASIPALTLSYNQSTAIITMTSTSTFQVNMVSTCSRILGLSKTFNMVATYGGGIYTLVFPYLINMLPTARLNFRSSLLQLENYHSNDKSNDVFLSLQNNANFGSMILYNNPTNIKHHIDIDNLSQLDIRITDDSSRYLDFQNSAWFLTIALEISYRTFPTKMNFSKLLHSNNKLLTELFSNLLEQAE